MVVFRFETSTKVTILKWVHDTRLCLLLSFVANCQRNRRRCARDARSGEHRAREDHGESANLSDRQRDHVPEHEPARHRPPLAELVGDRELGVNSIELLKICLKICSIF